MYHGGRIWSVSAVAPSLVAASLFLGVCVVCVLCYTMICSMSWSIEIVDTVGCCEWTQIGSFSAASSLGHSALLPPRLESRPMAVLSTSKLILCSQPNCMLQLRRNRSILSYSIDTLSTMHTGQLGGGRLHPHKCVDWHALDARRCSGLQASSSGRQQLTGSLLTHRRSRLQGERCRLHD